MACRLRWLARFRVHMLHSSGTPAGSLEPLIPDVLPQEAIDGDLKQLQKLPVVFERVDPERWILVFG